MKRSRRSPTRQPSKASPPARARSGARRLVKINGAKWLMRIRIGATAHDRRRRHRSQSRLIDRTDGRDARRHGHTRNVVVKGEGGSSTVLVPPSPTCPASARGHRHGLLDHPDHSHPERHRQPQQRRSQQMRIRIRHDGLLRVDSIVRLAAGVGLEPRGGVRIAYEPHGQHHLPLQDLSDERRRHEQRR